MDVQIIWGSCCALFLCVLFPVSCGNVQSSACMRHQYCFQGYLRKEWESMVGTSYSLSLPPRLNLSQPVTVYVDLEINQISSISTDTGSIFSYIQLSLSWWDELHNFTHLVTSHWLPKVYPIPTKHLWLPDLVILNGEVVEVVNEGDALISPGGYILWVRWLQVRTDCLMEAVAFPFDAYTCYIHLSSMDYNQHELVIVPTRRCLDSGAGAGSWWKVQEVTAHVQTQNITDSSENPLLIYSLHIQRQSSILFFRVMVPLLLEVLLGSVYLVTHDTTEWYSHQKSLVLVATIGAITTNVAILQNELPESSVSFLMWYSRCVMLLYLLGTCFHNVILGNECYSNRWENVGWCWWWNRKKDQEDAIESGKKATYAFNKERAKCSGRNRKRECSGLLPPIRTAAEMSTECLAALAVMADKLRQELEMEKRHRASGISARLHGLRRNDRARKYFAIVYILVQVILGVIFYISLSFDSVMLENRDKCQENQDYTKLVPNSRQFAG